MVGNGILEKLGASPMEDHVYRHLVSAHALTVGDLARALGQPAGRVEEALRALEARGFVARDQTDMDAWVAEPPELAVEALLADRERDLREIRQALAEVSAEFRAVQRARNRAVEFASGPDAMSGWLKDLTESARHEIASLVRPPYMVVGVSADAVLPSKEQMRPRMVYDRSVLDDPAFLPIARESAGPEEELRVHPSVPMKLMIFDKSVALLPFARPAVSMAAIVWAPGLVEALCALFEHIWQDSTPLVLDTPHAGAGPLARQDRELLSLLLAGLTDEAIARELGITVRTVGRRVRQLMDAAGVNTRIQLGWHAARRGWVASAQP